MVGVSLLKLLRKMFLNSFDEFFVLFGSANSETDEIFTLESIFGVKIFNENVFI